MDDQLKNSVKKQKMIDFMPEELLFEILQRLPVKSLVRFTAVSSSWHDLIICSKFISKHRVRKDIQKKTHQILFGNSTEQEQCVFSYNDRLCDDSLSKIELPFSFAESAYAMVGSANGLVCIDDNARLRDRVIIFWNPFIKKSLYTRPPNLDSVNFKWRNYQRFYFGYDHVNNDYKLLRIMSLTKNMDNPVVDLFSLSTGKWEDISLLARGLSCNFYCVCMNGVHHWLGRVKHGHFSVVSFNLADNEFRSMMLPEDIHKHVTFESSIHVYRGLLAIFLFDHDYVVMTSKLCTWVMKSYGDVESWTKLYNIDFAEPFKSLVGIGLNSSLLLLDSNQCLVSLDFKESNCEELEGNGCVRSVKWSYIKVVTVTESLVLLDLGREFCDDATCQRINTDIHSRKR